jgi:hypothetical protein
MNKIDFLNIFITFCFVCLENIFNISVRQGNILGPIVFKNLFKLLEYIYRITHPYVCWRQPAKEANLTLTILYIKYTHWTHKDGTSKLSPI